MDPKELRRLLRLYERAPLSFTEEQEDQLLELAREAGYNAERASDVRLSGILGQATSGFISGLTTIDSGEEPKNTAEAIARSTGHLAGFVGFVPGAGWLLKGAGLGIGLGVKGVRAVKGGEKVIDTFKAARDAINATNIGSKTAKTLKGLYRPTKFGGFIPSIPMTGGRLAGKAFDVLARGGTAARVPDAALGAIEFMRKGSAPAGRYFHPGRAYGVARGAIELGTAAGISSWQHGVDEVLKSAASGAVAGAAFSGIGEFVRAPNLVRDMYKSNPETADRVVRGLAGATFLGLPSSLRNEATEIQVYNYLLGGFFGFNQVPSATRIGHEKAENMSKEEAKDPTLIEGWNDLPKESQSIVSKIAQNKRASQSEDAILRGRIQEVIDDIKGKPPKITEPTNEKPDETSLAPKISMPMHFKDGTGGRKMRPEFRGKSTMDLILSGDRTATSRSPKAQEDVKKGDVIRFHDKEGNEVLVKATTGLYPLKEVTAEKWSKLEGWDAERFESLKKDGYKQFQFELIDKPVIKSIGTITSPQKPLAPAIPSETPKPINVEERLPSQEVVDTTEEAVDAATDFIIQYPSKAGLGNLLDRYSEKNKSASLEEIGDFVVKSEAMIEEYGIDRFDKMVETLNKRYNLDIEEGDDYYNLLRQKAHAYTKAVKVPQMVWNGRSLVPRGDIDSEMRDSRIYKSMTAMADALGGHVVQVGAKEYRFIDDQGNIIKGTKDILSYLATTNKPNELPDMISSAYEQDLSFYSGVKDKEVMLFPTYVVTEGESPAIVNNAIREISEIDGNFKFRTALLKRELAFKKMMKERSPLYNSVNVDAMWLRTIANNIRLAEKLQGKPFAEMYALNKRGEADFLLDPIRHNKRMQLFHSGDYKLDPNRYPHQNANTVIIKSIPKELLDKTKTFAQMDGIFVLEPEFYDRIALDGGQDKRSGAMKGTVMGLDPEHGVIMGKLAFFKANKTEGKILKEQGLHGHLYDTSAKVAGTRKSYKILPGKDNKGVQTIGYLNESGKQVTPDVYKLPLDNFRLNFGSSENVSKALTPVHIPIQFGHIQMPEQISPEITQKFWDFFYQRSINGDPALNGKIEEYFAFGDRSLIPEFRKDLKSNELEILVNKISVENISKIISDGRIEGDILYHSVLRHLIRNERGNLETVKGDDIVDAAAIKQYRDLISDTSAASKILRLGEPTGAIANMNSSRKIVDNLLRRYIQKRIMRPKVPYSFKAIGYSYTQTLEDLFPGLQPGEVFLARELKNHVIPTRVRTPKGGTKVVHMPMGKIIEQRDLLRKSKKKADIHQANLYDQAMYLMFERVPTDSVSGIRVVRVKGILEDQPGAGIIIHQEDMHHSGGMDLDIDSVFVFPGVPFDIQNAFRDMKNEFYIKDSKGNLKYDKGSRHDAAIIGTKKKKQSKSEDLADFLDPLTRFETAMNTAAGQRLVGLTSNMRKIMHTLYSSSNKHYETSPVESKQKSDPLWKKILDPFKVASKKIGHPLPREDTQGICNGTCGIVTGRLKNDGYKYGKAYITVKSPVGDWTIQHVVAITEIDGKRYIINQPQGEFMGDDFTIDNIWEEAADMSDFHGRIKKHEDLGGLRTLVDALGYSYEDVLVGKPNIIEGEFGKEDVNLVSNVKKYKENGIEWAEADIGKGGTKIRWTTGVGEDKVEGGKWGSHERVQVKFPEAPAIFTAENFVPRIIEVNEQSIAKSYGVSNEKAKANVKSINKAAISGNKELSTPDVLGRAKEDDTVSESYLDLPSTEEPGWVWRFHKAQDDGKEFRSIAKKALNSSMDASDYGGIMPGKQIQDAMIGTAFTKVELIDPNGKSHIQGSVEWSTQFEALRLPKAMQEFVEGLKGYSVLEERQIGLPELIKRAKELQAAQVEADVKLPGIMMKQADVIASLEIDRSPTSYVDTRRLKQVVDSLIKIKKEPEYQSIVRLLFQKSPSVSGKLHMTIGGVKKTYEYTEITKDTDPEALEKAIEYINNDVYTFASAIRVLDSIKAYEAQGGKVSDLAPIANYVIGIKRNYEEALSARMKAMEEGADFTPVSQLKEAIEAEVFEYKKNLTKAQQNFFENYFLSSFTEVGDNIPYFRTEYYSYAFSSRFISDANVKKFLETYNSFFANVNNPTIPPEKIPEILGLVKPTTKDVEEVVEFDNKINESYHAPRILEENLDKIVSKDVVQLSLDLKVDKPKLTPKDSKEIREVLQDLRIILEERPEYLDNFPAIFAQVTGKTYLRTQDNSKPFGKILEDATIGDLKTFINAYKNPKNGQFYFNEKGFPVKPIHFLMDPKVVGRKHDNYAIDVVMKRKSPVRGADGKIYKTDLMIPTSHQSRLAILAHAKGVSRDIGEKEIKDFYDNNFEIVFELNTTEPLYEYAWAIREAKHNLEPDMPGTIGGKMYAKAARKAEAAVAKYGDQLFESKLNGRPIKVTAKEAIDLINKQNTLAAREGLRLIKGSKKWRGKYTKYAMIDKIDDIPDYEKVILKRHSNQLHDELKAGEDYGIENTLRFFSDYIIASTVGKYPFTPKGKKMRAMDIPDKKVRAETINRLRRQVQWGEYFKEDMIGQFAEDVYVPHVGHTKKAVEDYLIRQSKLGEAGQTPETLRRIKYKVESTIHNLDNPDKDMVYNINSLLLKDEITHKDMLEALGSKNRPTHAKSRNRKDPVPGYVKSTEAWRKYFLSLNRAKVNMNYLLSAQNVLANFQKVANPVYTKNDLLQWTRYMKLRIRADVGADARIPSHWIGKNKLPLTNNPYYWLSNDMAEKLVNKFPKSMRDSILKTDDPKEIDDRLRWLSHLDAKYNMISLLSHTKAMANNYVGGSAMTIVKTGLKPWLRAGNWTWMDRNLPYTEAENVIIKKGGKAPIRDRAYWVDFAAKYSGVETWLRDELGSHPEYQGKTWNNFRRQLTKKLQDEESVDQATVWEIARRTGVLDKIEDKAAFFMRVSEERLRVRSFLSHLIQAMESFDIPRDLYPLDSPFLIDVARQGVINSQFLYNNSARPLFLTGAGGRIFGRFQLYTYKAVQVNAENILIAKEAGWDPKSEEFKIFTRMTQIQLFLFALALALPYSIFSSATTPPLEDLKDLSDFMFGDKKEREKAFFGRLPWPINIVEAIAPPSARFLLDPLGALLKNDWNRFFDYYLWTWFPFGRAARDIKKLSERPYLLVETTTGLPIHQMNRYFDRLGKEETPVLSGIGSPRPRRTEKVEMVA